MRDLASWSERSRDIEFMRGRAPEHAVIPHQNYSSLPNTVARRDARSALGIPQVARVMLVFGAIRNDAERQLVLDTFRGLDVPRKRLLVSRWRERLPDVSWIRLRYWLRALALRISHCV